MEWMDKIELLDQQIILLLNGSNNPFFDQLMWLATLIDQRMDYLNRLKAK